MIMMRVMIVSTSCRRKRINVIHFHFLVTNLVWILVRTSGNEGSVCYSIQVSVVKYGTSLPFGIFGIKS